MAARRASAAGIRLRKDWRVAGLSAKTGRNSFVSRLQICWPELGWIEGRNIHVDYSRAARDRMTMPFAAVHGSVVGTLEKSGMSALRSLSRVNRTCHDTQFGSD